MKTLYLKKRRTNKFSLHIPTATLSLIFSSLLSLSVISQSLGVSATGTPPDGSAMLDVAANDKGVLVPRMTVTSRDNINAPANGLIVYNTDCGMLNYYDCDTWREIGKTFEFPTFSEMNSNVIINGNKTPSQNEMGVPYLIPLVEGATSYTWTVSSGGTIATGQGTNSVTVDFTTPGMGFICVTAINACGTKIQTCMNLDICPLPAQPGIIAGDATPNENSAGNTYSISAVPTANTYTWTVPAGATITAGQGTTSITVDFALGASNGNICVAANGDCGTGISQCLALTMQCPAPTVPTANVGTNINATDFDANWSASSGVTDYYLDVSTDANFGSFVSGFNNLNVGNVTTYNVTGLTCATDYYYRVRAENPCGTTNSSNVETVTMGSCCTNYTGSTTFNYTGSAQTWTVPSDACNTSVTIEVWGAGGGKGYKSGVLSNNGLGGYAKGDKTVNANDVMYVYVGGKGVDGASSGGGGQGGWNGGGQGGNYSSTYVGGGGGGASDVRYNGQTLNDRIIVGGGAGGGSYYVQATGGNGGYSSGSDGLHGTSGVVNSYSGMGGTQSAGGNGGASGGNGSGASNGSFGLGSNAGVGSCAGGGGGGWYGGGGGSNCNGAGGGGGSSYFGGMDSNTSSQNGIQTGNGKVTITW